MTARFTLSHAAHAALNAARATTGAVARAWRNATRYEGVLATVTFALIFASTLSSLDAVFTGAAPDWNGGGGVAYAQEAPRVAVRQQPVVRAQPLSLAPLPANATVEPGDYSFTTEELLGGPDLVLPVWAGKPDANAFTATSGAATGKSLPANGL